MCQEDKVKKCSKCEFPLSHNSERGWYCQACDPSGIDIRIEDMDEDELLEGAMGPLSRLSAVVQDMTDHGMIPDHTVKSKVEIREKLEELSNRPTGLVDDIALVWRGRIEALRWVIGEIDQL